MNEELRRDINALAELVMWISKEHGPAYQMAKRVLDAVGKQLNNEIDDRPIECKRGSEVILAMFLRSIGKNCSTTFRGKQFIEAADAIDRLAAEIKSYESAFEDIRDGILNGRYQLAEMNVDCDVINAVLGIIDDHDPGRVEVTEGGGT